MGRGNLMPTLFDTTVLFLLHTLRAGVALAWLPIGSSGAAARRMSGPLAVAIAMCAPWHELAALKGLAFLPLILKEAMVGLGLGFVMSRIFVVVASAGAMLDQQAGYTMGAAYNPTFGASTGPIESIFNNLLVLSLIQAGGVLLVVKAVLASYATWPVDTWIPEDVRLVDLLHRLLGQAGQQMLEGALTVAAPVLVLLLLADICVAIAARYAQQLNPFSLAMAVKGIVALGALVAMASYPWADVLRSAVAGRWAP
jgi:type III secretory pathway component EscT